MICIINIDNEFSNQISSILTNNLIEHVLSTDEHTILSCEKLIITDTHNISKSLRKLKLMNLLSVLRLLNKPILGINQGMLLMCNKIGEGHQRGLGLINGDVIKLSTPLNGFYSTRIKENKVNNEKFLLDNHSSNQYYFNTNMGVVENQYSYSILEIDNLSITAAYSNNNIFGIQMSIRTDEESDNELLVKFARI